MVQLADEATRERARARLLDRREVTESGCWEYTGFRIRGYGKMSFAGKQVLSHRLAYMAWLGPIPDDLLVCHHCDNPPCFNPNHLYCGTPQTNSTDMIQRGRGMRGRRQSRTKRGHFRERSPGTWEVRTFAPAGPGETKGRVVTRTVKGTEWDANRALTALVAEVDAKKYPSEAHFPLQHLADEWVAARKDRWSPATLNTYQAHLNKNILPALGAMPIGKIHPRDLERHYEVLATRLSPVSVLKVHSMLSTMLRQAVRWGWLTASPIDRTEPPRATARRIEPPTVDQVRALLELAWTSDPDLAVFIHVAAATGARRGELCGLRHSDLEGAVLTIQRAVVHGPSGLTVKAPKTDRARALHLDDRTCTVIGGHWERCQVYATECGTTLKGGYLFAQDPRRRKPWNPSSVSHRFAELRTTAGFETVRLHDIRHYAATSMLDAGVPVPTVAARGGWLDANTLLRTYAHRVKASDESAGELLGGLLEGSGSD